MERGECRVEVDLRLDVDANNLKSEVESAETYGLVAASSGVESLVIAGAFEDLGEL